MRTQSAPTIRLKEYLPPLFDIRDVHLDISLDPENTRVRSSLTVVRRKSTDADAVLVMDGDELALSGVSINGKPVAEEDYTAAPDRLELRNLPSGKMFKLEIQTKLAPASNTKLMGLYQSRGVYCTQCEAEGFRRITYFLDRPDVLSIYTVRVEGDKKTCPLLLSNGNPIKKGSLPKGRHFAIWHDPHPKPSYLFAVVGGSLDAHKSNFKTASGRKVKLKIYVEPGKADMAAYAMDSLKRSMRWDEEYYGCEYDLDVFNIVAVSDFNMGAMENKGLNIFNDKYVLADPDLATDTDAMHIEAIIAHEYFHNWTGNRITCRDWFQLCLKEGLTVYRDQEFSADQRSRAVQRIQQVRTLKAGQFPEDAGPLAHNVRPAAYKEINNFYTATIYQKGAELVRMLATLVGPDAYRKSTDLYFKRHDGEAAVVEDWLKSFEDAAGINLEQFSKWYEQAGTPVVDVEEKYNRKAQTHTLTLKQSIPATPGQNRKQVVPIPLRFGLMDANGAPVTVATKSSAVKDDVIVLSKKSQTITFTGLKSKPVVSLLRGFSAPIILKFKQSDAARLTRARHDTDLYNRWEALNGYATNQIVKLSKTRSDGKSIAVDAELLSALKSLAFNDELEPEFRAQILTLPSMQDVAREIGSNIDPDRIERARSSAIKAIGKSFGDDGLKLVRKLKRDQFRSDNDIEAAGIRALKNALLILLVSAKVAGALDFAKSQFRNAKNMTDRMAALNMLVHHQTTAKIADEALAQFYKKYKDNALVLDKWFSTQAMISGNRGLTRVKKLFAHESFSFENPNRTRALLGAFASANMSGFHRSDGAGYAFFAEKIVALDKVNPQIAARLLTLMNNWRSMQKTRSSKARVALQQIATTTRLSRDVQEIVDRMLA